jgi:hypothetical protein
MTTSVTVTPLQPPFEGEGTIHRFRFAEDDRELVVDKTDGDKILAMLDSSPIDRIVKLEAAEDGVRIHVSVLPN